MDLERSFGFLVNDVARLFGRRFDHNGRRVDAPLVIFQWQKGVPVTVYPQGPGTVKAKWAMK